MDISSLLVIVVFSILIFLEKEPSPETAYNKLGLNLGNLIEKLEELRDCIQTEDNTTRPIDNGIDALIKSVDDTRSRNFSLAYSQLNVSIEVRKYVGNSSEVEKMQNDIGAFIQSTDHSSGKLNLLLDSLEKTWQQIEGDC